MTKPDGVLEIIRNALAQDRLYQLGQPFLEDYDKKAAHAIREYLAGELEGLKKKIHEPVVDQAGEFQLCECDNCCDNEYYNDIITAAQERVRKGGQP